MTGSSSAARTRAIQENEELKRALKSLEDRLRQVEQDSDSSPPTQNSQPQLPTSYQVPLPRVLSYNCGCGHNAGCALNMHLQNLDEKVERLTADMNGLKKDFSEKFTAKISNALKEIGIIQAEDRNHENKVGNFVYADGRAYALQPVDPNVIATPPRGSATNTRFILPRQFFP